MSAAPTSRTDFQLHMGLAEQGKVHALRQQHVLALAYYRQAMHLTVQAKEPEVLFRHYLECAVESLERMASYEEVLEYCQKAIGHYEKSPPSDSVADLDLAHIHQREGAVLLKMGRTEAAGESLERAAELARTAGAALPLAERLLRWIALGMYVEPRRVTMEQEKAGYFSVRPDTVDPTRAVELPAQQLGVDLSI